MATDEDELEKLKSLLDYGINHNEEHQDEMKEWAEIAKDLSKPEVHDLLVQASDALGQVTDYLGRAMEKMKESGG